MLKEAEEFFSSNLQFLSPPQKQENDSCLTALIKGLKVQEATRAMFHHCSFFKWPHEKRLKRAFVVVFSSAAESVLPF